MEVLWCASNRQQHLVLSDPFSVCGDTVKDAKSVRDLGIFLDSDMSMKTHVADYIQLFCISATDTQHLSLRQSASFTLSSPRCCCRA